MNSSGCHGKIILGGIIMGKSFVERNRIRRLQRARRLHRSMKAVKDIVSSAMSVGFAMATVWLVAAVLCG